MTDTNLFSLTHHDISPLEQLQQVIGYQFFNKHLLVQSLTHKSYAHEHQIPDNERLEFLGDAVLQFLISDFLIKRYPNLPEGMLSKFRAVLVSETGLSQLARKINLGQYLFIGKGEELTNGREKRSILSDAFEALVAAIYIDSRDQSDIQTITRIVHNLFDREISAAEDTFANVDHKTDFQEFVQKHKLGDLRYEVIEESGPDHDKEFVTALMIAEEIFGIGRGRSKKISEQNAAIDAFERLKGNKDD